MLACCVSLNAGAAEKRKPTSEDGNPMGANITDKKAEALFKAIDALGIGDCGMGTCGTELPNLDCAKKGKAVFFHHYVCTYGEEGGGEKSTVSGKEAKNIYKALKAAGVKEYSSDTSTGFGLLRDVTCTTKGHSVDDVTAPTCSVLFPTE